LLCIAFASSAWAQPTPAPLRPEPQPIPYPAAPQGGLDLSVPSIPRATFTLDSPILVKAFRVTGSTTVSDHELASLLSPWTGRTLGAEEIALAAGAVTTHLRARGLLVAQTYVPPQVIRDGVVELAVIEGRIGEITLDVQEGTRVGRSVAQRFLARLQPGDSIRRDNVEESLLLLNDLPGVRLSGALAQGAQPGTADLAAGLRNEGNRVTGALTVDNAGVRGIGDYRANLDLRLASPLRLGDLLAARLLQSSEGGHSQASLTYGLPVNGLGTRIGARYTEQRYRLGREFAPLDAHGESRAASLLASHPLLRRGDENVTLFISYTEFAFHDRQDAVAFASDSKQRIAGAGLSGDVKDRLLGGGATAFLLQYLAGRAVLENADLAAFDAGPGGLGVAGSFNVLRSRLQRAQALDARSSLYLSVNAQLASKNLDAGTELAVGGPDAVRAYPVGELYADQGYVAQIEYRRAFGGSGQDWWSAFVDTSKVLVNRNAIPGDTANRRGLSGYGLGVNYALSRDVGAQILLAWKHSKDAPTAAPGRSPRVWVSAVARF
jgi:hemolysin activation/secretion protein